MRRMAWHQQPHATFNLLQNRSHSSATVNPAYRSFPAGSTNMTLFNFMSPANALFATAVGSRSLSGTAYSEPGIVPGTNPALQIPIDLVFQRLFRSEEQTRRIESSITRQSGAVLLQRLDQQSQRIEAAGSASAALTTRHMPQFTDSKITSSHASSGSAATNRAVDQSTWPEVNRPMPPMNIDVLTDQVMRQLDRRIIAARERMGKI